MNIDSDRLRHIVVQGWAGMLSLLLLMMLTDLMEFGMKGDFSPLSKDPGTGGLWFIAVVICINVLVQISVRSFDGKYFRWAIFGATTLYTLVFIGHQTTHLMLGEGFDIHAVLDITHHILGIWASAAAFRWATRNSVPGTATVPRA